MTKGETLGEVVVPMPIKEGKRLAKVQIESPCTKVDQQ